MANVFGKTIGKVKGKKVADTLAEEVGFLGKGRAEASKDFAADLAEKADLTDIKAPSKAVDDLSAESDDIFGKAAKSSDANMSPDASLDVGKMSQKASSEAAGAVKPGKAFGDLSPDEQADQFIPDKKGWKSKVPTVAKGLGFGGGAAGLGYAMLRGSDPELPVPGQVKQTAAPVEGEKEKSPAMPKGPSRFYASQAKDPEAVKAAYAELQLPDQADQYDEMQKALVQDLNAAQAVYENAKDSLATRELWEKVIQGVGLMAAGAYGQRTGIDVSGVKFDPSDWDKKREAARADLRQSIDNAVKNNDISKEKLNRIYERNKDQMNLNQDAIKSAEQRDQFNAEMRHKANEVNQQRELKLMELGMKAQEGGNEKAVEAVKSFKKLEEKIGQDITTFSKGVENEGLRQDLAAQVILYEQQADALGIPKGQRLITREDLAASKDPAAIREASVKRLAAAVGESPRQPSSSPSTQTTTSAPAPKPQVQQAGSPAHRAQVERLVNAGKLPATALAEFDRQYSGYRAGGKE